MEKNNFKTRSYYLGLDIGTNSVGYAVTDEDYNLLKHCGEPMWGAHIFDEGNQCAERRGFRSARRRLDRKQQRVKLVQDIFAEEISKIDSRFFIRIKESGLHRDDVASSDRYVLFNDEAFTDREFYLKYPTIHHLICALMYSDEVFDVRLVYLACAWLVAHRGHFLSEVNKDNISEVLDFSKVYDELISYLRDNGYSELWDDTDANKKLISEILLKKIGVSKKENEFKEKLYNGKFPKDEDSDIDIQQLIKILSGATVDLKKAFPNLELEENLKICFKKSEEDFLKCVEASGEYAELLIKLRGLYDWALLSEACESDSISKTKVKIYEQHKKDLKFLKGIIRKYLPDKYKEIFVDVRDDNYVAYSYNFNSVSENKRNQCKDKASAEEFCTYIKKIVSNITPDEADKSEYDDMLDRLGLFTFMPKQVMGDNRVIPYQLYYHELKCILDKAASYLRHHQYV